MITDDRGDGGVCLWSTILQPLLPAFTEPGSHLFQLFMVGWVLCTTRRTIVGIAQQADPFGIHAHDAFHRLVRCAAWSVEQIWQLLAVALVKALLPKNAVIEIDLDDTLLHRTGRKVDGAGTWRDAVRSFGRRTVVAWGLNVLLVTLRIRPPWGGEPLGLPIWVQIHRKGGPKLTQLARDAVTTIASWFPGRRIRCCADGAYASTLMDLRLDLVTCVSRIRRDAALYQLKPRPTGKRGRPRTRGARIGTPTQIAAKAKTWTAVKIDRRGKIIDRKIHHRDLLWYGASKHPVRLVICRDPDGHEPDDFFVCSDTATPPQEIVSAYAGRWAIEDTFRATKQTLHIQQPQSWRGQGPTRAATLGFLLYSLVWWWFLALPEGQQKVKTTPWFTTKCTPSFADAIASLRTAFWKKRISDDSGDGPISAGIQAALLDALARAA